MGNSPSVCCTTKNNKRDITLLMLGLDNAGKTSTVKNFLKESTEDVVPTVGFSTVEMRYKNHNVTIYDLGGGAGIRGIWRNYYALVHGVIFVVDSSAIERLAEIKSAMGEVLKDSRISGKPVLLLVNKQDVDGALNEVELCTALDVEALINEQQCPTRVETSCAIGTMRRKRKRVRDKGIDDGFQWLLSHISENFLPMNDRVSRELSKQQEQEELDKQERLLRVQKIREEREKQQQMLNRSAKGRASIEHDDDCGEQDLNPFRPITEFHKDRAERKASVGGPRIIHVTPAVSPDPDQETGSIHSEPEERKQCSVSEEENSDTTLILVHEPPHKTPPGEPLPQIPQDKKKKKKKFANKVGSVEESAKKTCELPPLRWEHANGPPQHEAWATLESVQDKLSSRESIEKDLVQTFTVTDSLTSLHLSGT